MKNRIRYKKSMRKHKRSVNSVLKEAYMSYITDFLYTPSIIMAKVMTTKDITKKYGRK